MGWDGSKEGLSRISNLDLKARPYDEYNLIIFTIEDILQRESVFSMAMKEYLDEIAFLSKWSIIAITGGACLILVLFILTLIQRSIVKPITALTNKIKSSKKVEDVDSFLQHI